MASGVLDIQEFVKSFGSVVIKDGDRADKWMEVAVFFFQISVRQVQGYNRWQQRGSMWTGRAGHRLHIATQDVRMIHYLLKQCLMNAC